MSETPSQGVPAVGFLIMAFKDEKAGDEALKAMQEAKRQGQFYFEDAAVIRQDASGKVHYRETGDMRMGKGASAGALIGGILGILGGPAGIAIGAGAGAALGAAASHGDAGFRDESLKTIGLALKPGTSAVTVITSDAFLRAIQEQVPIEDTRNFVSNLAGEISNTLADGKSLAFGVLLAEDGLAFKRVAVDENSAEVVGMAMTDEAVVAGAAVVTAEGVSYEVVAASEEGALIEAGVVTPEGALIVDDVVTEEGEAAVATVLLPEETGETQAEGEPPGETGEGEEKPAEA